MALPPVPEEPATAVIVPIRSFDGALSRLAGILGDARCRELMLLMAHRVVAAAERLPVHVVTDDAEVAAWATDLGAAVVAAGRPGLTIAVTTAVDQLAGAGAERAVVAHADLALARTLQPAVGPGLTIVGDRRRDGSNVVCVPTAAGFRFSYGPGSFGRHVAEAERLGLEVNIVDDASLSVDIDHPEDLRHLPEDLRGALGLDELVTSR
ncbi:MAG: 2-phospho-L-lactate guanylyltransferase [Acidimicrobiaceae bacterium]|nr:2-phospho-L-lactate guanylyltransferase [Acidimicrobiaceae bacterium]MCY3642640.1 2-phospho-L-lactate guanylyltransferase [Acidimicrobiaceae bacterium]MDE0495400.1 2-phospho-L-lactate guanylyltransferase [Acidimicrobiaceae bacterium]MDE0664632.1 2-phospho-L-lactate guanylyltransferase [Acidimicrobiaceae bacterium]